MRQRRVNPKLCWPRRSEEHPGKQPTALHTPGEVAAARVKATEGYKKAVGRDVAVTTEHAIKALPEIGNDHDISFVVPGAGFDPALPLAHFIGRSQVCISVSAPNLQAAEFVDQEEVDHTGDRVRSIHSRGAIFKDVNVIDHRERYQVNVRASAEPGHAQRTGANAFSID